MVGNVCLCGCVGLRFRCEVGGGVLGCRGGCGRVRRVGGWEVRVVTAGVSVCGVVMGHGG